MGIATKQTKLNFHWPFLSYNDLSALNGLNEPRSQDEI